MKSRNQREGHYVGYKHHYVYGAGLKFYLGKKHFRSHQKSKKESI